MATASSALYLDAQRYAQRYAQGSFSASVTTGSYWCYYASAATVTPAQWDTSAQPPTAREERRLAAAEESMQRLYRADDRAEALLRENLSPEQLVDYRRRREFDVVKVKFGSPPRRYRITRGWAGNVFLVGDDGAMVAKFCIHPVEEIPFADNMLAQKLMLELDEEQFLRVANRTALRAA